MKEIIILIGFTIGLYKSIICLKEIGPSNFLSIKKYNEILVIVA